MNYSLSSLLPPKIIGALDTQNGRKTRPRLWSILAGVIIIAGVIFYFLLRTPGSNKNIESGPNVAVVKATREDLSTFMTLYAEFRPYQEVSVHAKVAGYVELIAVDIGDRVKSGQLLAKLEVPELNDDLKKAGAEWMVSQEEVKHAEANYEQAHISYQRLAEVGKEHPKLVAQADLDIAKAKNDEAQSTLLASQRHVEECAANQGKYQTMLDYASIRAPFDGVITKRYVDTGSMVQAGIASNTQAMPLVDIADEDRLRLVFPVPESSVSIIHVGVPVEITIHSLHQTFIGTISRYSDKVDRATRTMETEVDVPNPNREITPGMYASVKLAVEKKTNVITVPLQALSLGENPTILTLNKENQIEEHKVTLGLQTSTQAEILTGLTENALVVVGSRLGIHLGQKAIGKTIEIQTVD